MTTIRDVAKAAGVSTATVSAVINESAYVSPDLRARVTGDLPLAAGLGLLSNCVCRRGGGRNHVSTNG